MTAPLDVITTEVDDAHYAQTNHGETGEPMAAVTVTPPKPGAFERNAIDVEFAGHLLDPSVQDLHLYDTTGRALLAALESYYSALDATTGPARHPLT